ncbi:UDP-3-O-acyl-N-acetylglucosamine deacetylase [Desulfomarina profundi]|uniref:UDP-3-O-acyl-N-acetylglucosamine deacetylase n=1 Tax=Desulfomarina profundi TaxID=2772557 RepID=A0A8D5FSX8_9BACT|nr:UDP-3-O-acyl-N-acetylglucosamine deacetylase [Desulfomarina profundi]BCL60821.1 UDP-3-O-acyl-N-acetylglucosamine deacetylase [Desulfomarina profundi]
MTLHIDPYQYTLQKSVSCCGVGLHSGRTVNLSIKPAPEDSGIRFFRTDIQPTEPIQAHMDMVVDTRLATTIGNERIQVSTTEHLLAALKAFGIDNAEIELDSREVPIMDGSAEPFFQLIKSSGKKKQKSFKKILKITQPIHYDDGEKSISISPYNGFKVTGEICFDDTVIQNQKFSLDLSPENFGQEISKARTFGYVEQVEELWANGLALGSTLDNVIAIHWNRKSVLNEDGLRFDDEFIRHKVLDLVGDLSLLGCPILGHVNAYKTGHTEHFHFMKAIAASPHCWEVVEVQKNGSIPIQMNVSKNSQNKTGTFLPFLNNRDAQPAAA